MRVQARVPRVGLKLAEALPNPLEFIEVLFVFVVLEVGEL
jgi:hypothetical protein